MDFDKLDKDYADFIRPDPTIPFGKHKGSKASDIDAEYLDWLMGQDWLFEDLRDQLQQHLEGRQDWRQM